MSPENPNGNGIGGDVVNGREATLVQSTYNAVVQAWSFFSSSIDFPDDTDDLALRLHLEQLRLQAWGKIISLERHDPTNRLLAVSEIIIAVLDKLKKLFIDSDQARGRYGLSNESGSGGRWQRSRVKNGSIGSREPKPIVRVMNAIGSGRHSRQPSFQLPRSRDAESINETASIRSTFAKRLSHSKNSRWTVRDRVAFVRYLVSIQACLTQLEALLSDFQSRAFAEERTRMSISLISSILGRSDLDLVQRAAQIENQDVALCHMLERKAISDALAFNDFSENGTILGRKSQKILVSLNASDFHMPEASGITRFLTSSKTWHGTVVLLERKDFPSSTDPAEIEKYEARIQRLALLLSDSNGSLNMLRAMGYFTDPVQPCWWLAFEFPLRQRQAGTTKAPMRLTSSTRPISLFRMLTNRSTNWKPALDDRVRLASKLAVTLSALFSGGWLHKSLRSANVLFPYMYSRKDKKNELDPIQDTSKPMLSGFEYSQPGSESSDCVIYRHPQYSSGPLSGGLTRPKPYSIHFDIYSFGLMLVEIALWMPLLDFLDANAADFIDGENASDIVEGETGPLSPKVNSNDFTSRDAAELQRRVLHSVKTSIAYLMGRQYRDAAKWCLMFADAADKPNANVASDAKVPALEFYDRVVVPLEHLAKLGNA